MKSRVFYTRAGEQRSLILSTRLVPNMLAVKFSVLAHEMDDASELAGELEPAGRESFIEAQLRQMDIAITDVSPVACDERRAQ